MYSERKIEGGTICGLLDNIFPAEKAEKTAEEVKVEKATEEKPKTAKTAQKRKTTK